MKREIQGVFEHKLQRGTWCIDYYDREGRRHREKIGSRDLAIAMYRKRKTEIWEGRFVPRSREPKSLFREVAEARMQAAKHRLRPQSYRSDEIRIKPLLAHFGERAIDQVTPARIEAWLTAKRESGVSGSTVNRYHALLSSILSFAVRSEKIAANPARRVKRFKESDPRVRYLTDDEEAAIRKVLRWQWPEGEAELDIYLHTGLRRSELFSLRWEDVDLDNGILIVTGKGGDQEIIRLNSVARAAILKLHRASNGSPFVSVRRTDPRQKDYGRRLERCIRTAGIENFAPYHGLRHTFGSRLAMAGVDLRSIQDLMRHKTIAMTIRYLHLSPEHQRANVERLVTRMDTKPIRKNRKVRQMLLSK